MSEWWKYQSALPSPKSSWEVLNLQSDHAHIHHIQPQSYLKAGWWHTFGWCLWCFVLVMPHWRYVHFPLQSSCTSPLSIYCVSLSSSFNYLIVHRRTQLKHNRIAIGKSTTSALAEQDMQRMEEMGCWSWCSIMYLEKWDSVILWMKVWPFWLLC